MEHVIERCANKHGPEGLREFQTHLGKMVGIQSMVKDPRVTALVTGDLQGRISKAMSTVDRFNRWGAHYLRALVRSHQLQVCFSFLYMYGYR